MIRPTRPLDTSVRGDVEWATRPLGALVDTATELHPDEIAIVDGEHRITYRELRRRIIACGERFRRHGVDPGDVVMVQLPNWWEANVAILALLRIGAVANPVVPIYRERELRFIVQQASPRAIVMPHRFRNHDYPAMFDRVLDGLEVDPALVVVRPDGELSAGERTFVRFDTGEFGTGDLDSTPDVVGDVDDVALVLYTSGTTADPKGVLHDHRTLAFENRTIIELFDLDAGSGIFMPSPVTHITGFLYGVLLPAMLGATVTLLDVWEPGRARDLLERERCRFVVGATPFLHGLVDVYASDAASRPDCPLDVFACGGADVPPTLVRRAREVLDATVVRVYGSSEVPTVSCGGPDDPVGVAADTDGRPIGPMRCRLADTDAHGVGELIVLGPEMFLGYLDPDLNDEAFTSDGWFRTGDLASIGADGAVTIRGRSKDIIVRGGENISAKEVEDLLFAHPDVRAVAVVAMPDRVMVEKACAFVVPEPGRTPTLGELADHLEACGLARQKLPERVELVDELPMTSSGKVQKFVLREQIAAKLDGDAPPPA